jgi:hypothetical protein
MFASHFCLAQGKMSAGYVISSMSSEQVKDLSLSTVSASYDYMVVPTLFPSTRGFAGLSWNGGTAEWTSSGNTRKGFVNDVRLNFLVDYPIKEYSVYGGFKIPVFSKVIVAGAMSADLSQGFLESSSLAKYAVSGFEMFAGGDYKVGSFSLFGVSMDASAALNLSYSFLNMKIEQTASDSSFDDFDGAINHEIGISGLGIMVALNFAMK